MLDIITHKEYPILPWGLRAYIRPKLGKQRRPNIGFYFWRGEMKNISGKSVKVNWPWFRSIIDAYKAGKISLMRFQEEYANAQRVQGLCQ